MRIRIYSLKGIVFDDECKSLNVKTINGEITVLDNHTPLITLLKKCVASIVRENGEVKKIDINGGFLEVVSKGAVDILVD